MTAPPPSPAPSGTASSSSTAGWRPRWRRAGTTCPRPSGRPACCSTGRTRSSRRTVSSSPPAPRSPRRRRTRCPSPASPRRASAPRDAASALRRSVELAERARCAMPPDRPRGWPPPSGRTAPRWPTGRSTAATTALAWPSCGAWHRPRLRGPGGRGRRRAGARDHPLPGRGGGAAGRGATATGAPAWLSVTCRPVATRAGEPVDEAFAMAADVRRGGRGRASTASTRPTSPSSVRRPPH